MWTEGHKSQENQAAGISSKRNIYTENPCFSLLGLLIILPVKFLSKWFIVQQHLQGLLVLLSEGANIQIFLFWSHILLLWPSIWAIIELEMFLKVKFFLLEAVNKMLCFKSYWWSVCSESRDLGEQPRQQTHSREIKELQGCLEENNLKSMVESTDSPDHPSDW